MRQTILNLKISKIEQYLSHIGWTKKISERNYSVWNYFHDVTFVLILPIDRSLDDYERRMLDAFDLIAEAEETTVENIVNDIQSFFSDNLKIQVKHKDVNTGTIPIEDGVLLVQKSKELFTAGVLSAFSKKKYFQGSRSKEISTYLSKARLGQTEVGSYIVNILAPLEITTEKQHVIDTVPTTRLVMNNIDSCLNALSNTINQYKESADRRLLDKAVLEGVSANLCDSIIGLSGKGLNRDISISINLSRFESSFHTSNKTHSFESSLIPIIQFASDYYKENYSLQNYLAVGYVESIKHSHNDIFGTVIIRANIDDKEKSISFDIDMDSYWEAHEAHKKDFLVECIGDINVTPKGAYFVNVSAFRVIKNKEIFD